MSTAARRAIYGKLSGDGTLTGLLGAPAAGYSKAIYHENAPAAAVFPFIVFSKSSGTPLAEGFAATPEALENTIWLIKCIDHNTTADRAEAIAARLTKLLNDATLSISAGSTQYLRRESDVEYSEVDQGEVIHHVGALYRLAYSYTP